MQISSPDIAGSVAGRKFKESSDDLKIENVKISNSKDASKSLQKSTLDFFKLFCTTLKHQDPTDPTKIKDLLPQIAQLHSVEQNINTNVLLEKLVELTSFNNQSSYIGQMVIFKHEGGEVTIQLTDSKAETKFEVEGEAAKAFIVISTVDGKRILAKDIPCHKGWNSFNWDGQDAYGNQVEDNIYKIQVFVKDAQGREVTVKTLSEGKVTSTKSDQGNIILKLDNGLEINAKNVVERLEDTNKSYKKINSILAKFTDNSIEKLKKELKINDEIEE